MAKTKAARGKRRPGRAKSGRSASAKLALLGGRKTVTRRLPPWPHIDDNVVKAVTEALRKESLSPLVDGVPGRFEARFANYHSRKYALMVNSGTAALHLALAGCGVEPGDEVITTPYTWGATVGAILHHNAVPVFADIDPDTLCLDPEKLEERVTERTRAILPVHIYGMPADMGPIGKIARKHGLAVVEDCSQAAGAQYRSKLVGTWSDAGAFSLQASKNLTGGEGGILITNRRKLYQRALAFGAHPVRQRQELKGSELRAYIDSLGFSFRPHPLAAAIADAQLGKLKGWTEQKGRNFAQLFKRVGGIAEPHGADYMGHHKGVVHGYHMVALKVVHPELARLPRWAIREALHAEGMSVGTYVGRPIPLRRRFRDLFFYGRRGCPWTCRHASRLPDYSQGSWPVAERLCRRGEIILLGNHYVRDTQLMDQYARAIEKLAGNVEELKTYVRRKRGRQRT
ncbi:MAG: DegT/DnrJ/EryC1/StrS family aminotransferase [Candidatus Brocadiia bacterium]